MISLGARIASANAVFRCMGRPGLRMSILGAHEFMSFVVCNVAEQEVAGKFASLVTTLQTTCRYNWASAQLCFS